ncbi:hypothetical protein T492DRAFT_311549 [Pavlovales sp. CCMP2436]|nr:hypothetical protein T492DRAFT_311549 [Pavlovales sp. CCMP2436]
MVIVVVAIAGNSAAPRHCGGMMFDGAHSTVPDGILGPPDGTVEMAPAEHGRSGAHVFVLSNAGKPIFSTAGAEADLSSLSAVIQALVSFVRGKGDSDELHWVEEAYKFFQKHQNGSLRFAQHLVGRFFSPAGRAAAGPGRAASATPCCDERRAQRRRGAREVSGGG